CLSSVSPLSPFFPYTTLFRSIYPPILLADEPTGNLDTQTGEDILRLIRDLQQRLKSTVLIVTHDRVVAESCPRVVALRDGRVVRSEEHTSELQSRVDLVCRLL